MRLRPIYMALLGSLAVAAASILSAAVRRDHPLEARFIHVIQHGSSKAVTVEFERLDPRAVFSEDHQIRVQIAGRWQRPESFPPLAEGFSLARTNTQRLVFNVPAETQACWLSVRYHIGGSPYCRTYYSLQRYGLYQKSPKLTRLVLKCVPRKPRFRYVNIILNLPATTQNVGIEWPAGPTQECMSPLSCRREAQAPSMSVQAFRSFLRFGFDFASM